jgi:hypothetical protein
MTANNFNEAACRKYITLLSVDRQKIPIPKQRVKLVFNDARSMFSGIELIETVLEKLASSTEHGVVKLSLHGIILFPRIVRALTHTLSVNTSITHLAMKKVVFMRTNEVLFEESYAMFRAWVQSMRHIKWFKFRGMCKNDMPVSFVSYLLKSVYRIGAFEEYDVSDIEVNCSEEHVFERLVRLTKLVIKNTPPGLRVFRFNITPLPNKFKPSFIEHVGEAYCDSTRLTEMFISGPRTHSLDTYRSVRENTHLELLTVRESGQNREENRVSLNSALTSTHLEALTIIRCAFVSTIDLSRLCALNSLNLQVANVFNHDSERFFSVLSTLPMLAYVILSIPDSCVLRQFSRCYLATTTVLRDVAIILDNIDSADDLESFVDTLVTRTFRHITQLSLCIKRFQEPGDEEEDYYGVYEAKAGNAERILSRLISCNSPRLKHLYLFHGTTLSAILAGRVYVRAIGENSTLTTLSIEGAAYLYPAVWNLSNAITKSTCQLRQFTCSYISQPTRLRIKPYLDTRTHNKRMKSTSLRQLAFNALC